MHEKDEQPSPGESFNQHHDAVTALPQWRVMLHDDEVHGRMEVIDRLIETLPLNRTAATQRVLEAYRTGVATLLHTHQELAELYYVQLSKQNLIVTIERE